jgi:hypothetical protein
MSSPAVRNIKRLQPQDKRSRKIFFDSKCQRSTQDCHWRLRRFSEKDNHLGCPKQGVSCRDRGPAERQLRRQRDGLWNVAFPRRRHARVLQLPASPHSAKDEAERKHAAVVG